MTDQAPVTYSLPDAEGSGDGWTYRHTWTVNQVADPDAGPCKVCGRPTVRLDVTQHVQHNEARYDQHLDWIYAHADGSEHHGRRERIEPLSRCPQCRKWGTWGLTQEAYGDRYTCSACGHSAWYSIGD
jgi:hypothetical protein